MTDRHHRNPQRNPRSGVLAEKHPRVFEVPPALDIGSRAREHQLGRIRFDLSGPAKEFIAFLVVALLGQKYRQVDHTADIARRELHSLAELSLSHPNVLAFLGKPGKRVVRFGLAQAADSGGHAFRLIDPSSNNAGSLEVVLEEIAQRFQIRRIESHGLLE